LALQIRLESLPSWDLPRKLSNAHNLKQTNPEGFHRCFSNKKPSNGKQQKPESTTDLEGWRVEKPYSFQGLGVSPPAKQRYLPQPDLCPAVFACMKFRFVRIIAKRSTCDATDRPEACIITSPPSAGFFLARSVPEFIGRKQDLNLAHESE
jgi:hypothetical protein